jgi:hypothetical protein
MTRLIDGPHAGTTLALGRAPFLLRVVQDQAGTVDALDKIDDTVRPGETVLVYRQTTEPMTVHVDRRDPKTGRRTGHWYVAADYRLARVQPDQATAADNPAWQAWAQANRNQA